LDEFDITFFRDEYLLTRLPDEIFNKAFDFLNRKTCEVGGISEEVL